jgi:predicted phosphodiesterase
VRYGLLSDVHGNLPALEQAVRSLSALGVDRWVCAGDVVGYGPRPDDCVAAVAALDPLWVAGNHDLIAAGALGTRRCSRRARESLEWTAATLSPATREVLAGLPRVVTAPGLVVAHGSLDDPEEYVRGDAAATQLAALAGRHPGARVLVLGHTHQAQLYGAAGAVEPGADTRELAAEGGPWLVNPGSVGQSRQREPRPLLRCALLELGPSDRVRFVASGYDDRAVRAQLRGAGQPADSMHVRPGTLPTAVRRARRIARRIRPRR